MNINNLLISEMEEAAGNSAAVKEIKEAFRRLTKKMIYVCSPYRAETDEEVKNNVDYAIGSCRYVIDNVPDAVPLAPHIYFTQFLNDRAAADRLKGIEAGIALLGLCDELWVFGEKISDGMAAEIAYAKKAGIPVCYIDLIEGSEDNA